MVEANPQHWDAIVVGAGPAGCSAAAALALHGRRVLLLEREKFPRYHIGESLLPFTFHPLQRIGMLEKMRASCFVKKYSVQFVSPSGKASQPFYFYTRYPEEIAQTWQVLRSEFDQMLMDNAREKGAVVKEEHTLKEYLTDGPRTVGVKVQDKSGATHEYRAPMTLDCTGRESFTASRKGWRIPDPKLNKVAVWTYFKGALRDEGKVGGATTVAYVPQKGWFWYIPQHNDMISVGVVADASYLFREGVREPKDVFQREVKQNAWIDKYTSAGQQVGNYFVTGEYSFRSRHCASDGLLLAGDAFGFLDPIFSSGVMLALKSGVLAADAIHEALSANDVSAQRFEAYGKYLGEGIDNMRRLVCAFYEQAFSFRKICEKHEFAQGEITDCLSGDVNKDFSKLWAACEEFAPVEQPLPYGTPLVTPA
ncbi:MAG: tryptophan 7-halogenase [Planctomycetota bacterium]|nr:tryptophan 7-halogenase [Planctomycetota bacterium]